MIHHGDCLEVMAGMEPESVDAIVTDPPYGLEFMGKEWDKLDAKRGRHTGTERKTFSAGGRNFPSDRRPQVSFGTQSKNPKCEKCGKFQWDSLERKCVCPMPSFRNRHMGAEQQAFHYEWANAAFRVAKPSAYLLAFGGTRTVHRMTVALEDAGWIIRDMLVWAYASGFPKSKASLKPAWEPIVMARKPGPLRMLAIDACRIGFASDDDLALTQLKNPGKDGATVTSGVYGVDRPQQAVTPAGRWPANLILTDPIFDGGVEGVVGGGEAGSVVKFAQAGNINGKARMGGDGDGVTLGISGPKDAPSSYGDSGTYSRFFLVPKADRGDREPVLKGTPNRRRSAPDSEEPSPNSAGSASSTNVPRANVHPTVKPTELMRHLVRLVTPAGGTVLDPFLGSGTTGLACELEGFPWIGIEKEAEYVAIAEARLNGTQRGLGLAG